MTTLWCFTWCLWRSRLCLIIQLQNGSGLTLLNLLLLFFNRSRWMDVLLAPGTRSGRVVWLTKIGELGGSHIVLQPEALCVVDTGVFEHRWFHFGLFLYHFVFLLVNDFWLHDVRIITDVAQLSGPNSPHILSSQWFSQISAARVVTDRLVLLCLLPFFLRCCALVRHTLIIQIYASYILCLLRFIRAFFHRGHLTRSLGFMIL